MCTYRHTHTHSGGGGGEDGIVVWEGDGRPTCFFNNFKTLIRSSLLFQAVGFRFL